MEKSTNYDDGDSDGESFFSADEQQDQAANEELEPSVKEVEELFSRTTLADHGNEGSAVGTENARPLAQDRPRRQNLSVQQLPSRSQGSSPPGQRQCHKDHICKPNHVAGICCLQANEKCFQLRKPDSHRPLKEVLECTWCGSTFCKSCWQIVKRGHRSRTLKGDKRNKSGQRESKDEEWLIQFD